MSSPCFYLRHCGEIQDLLSSDRKVLNLFGGMCWVPLHKFIRTLTSSDGVILLFILSVFIIRQLCVELLRIKAKTCSICKTSPHTGIRSSFLKDD